MRDQARSLDQLHRKKPVAAFLDELMEMYEIRMVEILGRPELVLKTIQRLAVEMR